MTRLAATQLGVTGPLPADSRIRSGVADLPVDGPVAPAFLGVRPPRASAAIGFSALQTDTRNPLDTRNMASDVMDGLTPVPARNNAVLHH
jgi:hypothetical protein